MGHVMPVILWDRLLDRVYAVGGEVCKLVFDDVNVQNANGDIDTQISQIRYLIKKKVDVLVVVCIDSDGLADVIAEVQEKVKNKFGVSLEKEIIYLGDF